MTKRTWLLLALAAAGAVYLCAAVARCQVNDEAESNAVRALVAQMNRAWAERDAQLLGETLSDRGFVVAIRRLDDPSRAVIFDKASLCEAWQNLVEHNPPQRHEHRVEKIVVAGPLAYEAGAVTDVLADGETRRSQVVKVYAKDESGWKLITSVDAAPLREVLLAAEAD